MQLTVESDSAVQRYIDALLFDGAEPDAVATAAASAAPATGVAAVEPVVPAEPGCAAEPAAALPVDRGSAFVKHLQVAQAATAQRLAGRDGPLTRPKVLAQAPAWVDTETLSCLVFKVANLKLALPVQYLEGIEPFPGHQPLTKEQLESLAQWHETFIDCCLGQIGQRVMLDTARLVMPERYHVAMIDNYRKVLRLRDMDWCFAVDSIGSELQLNVAQVRWRSQHTRREWLAGTVIDQMCAIIDVDALHRLLLATSVLGDEPAKGGEL